MALYGSRRLFVAPLAGVERQGRGSVGGGGAEVGLSFPSCRHLHCLQNPSLFLVHAFSGLLQPAFCGDKSLRVLGTSYSLIYPQSEIPQDSLHYGDPSVCASVCVERRLDGVHRLEGLLIASSNTSGQLQVPQICDLESSLSIQGSLFRPLHGSAGFHTDLGFVIGLSPSSRDSPLSFLRRLADFSFFSSLSSSSFGHGFLTVSGTRDCGNWEKSNLLPAQSVVYLGVIIDSTLFRTSPFLPRV